MWRGGLMDVEGRGEGCGERRVNDVEGRGEGCGGERADGCGGEG